MCELNSKEIIQKVADTLIKASCVFPEDRIEAYKRAIAKDDAVSGWVMQQILDNAAAAERVRLPMCDDTGIPHLLIEAGKNRSVSGELLELIYEGVRTGLKELPGRPMGVKGDDGRRIDQSEGLFEEPDMVLPAPVNISLSEDDDRLRLTVMMLGGGPEIRAKTYRVFHRHSVDVVLDEIISWGREAVKQLGCSPCTLAVGIGRSHYEASTLMLKAMAEGTLNKQSEYEKRISDEVNASRIGALGLGGSVSVLGTFMKVGPQRASGVRIVCLRPCCCFEPRVLSVDL